MFMQVMLSIANFAMTHFSCAWISGHMHDNDDVHNRRMYKLALPFHAFKVKATWKKVYTPFSPPPHLRQRPSHFDVV